MAYGEGPFTGNRMGRVARHGTNAGYMVHRKYGEPACEACKAAHTEYRKSLPSYKARLKYPLR